jgi:CubicO group peptidase (beta-lactamase class C family)
VAEDKLLDDSELRSQIEHLLDTEAAADRFSGSVLLARGETPLLASARGYAIHPQVLPNHPDTRFNIASVTKMLTAVAVMQLAAAGRLDLDKQIAFYDSSLPHASEVTARQLLLHTAGFDYYWNDAYRAARSDLRAISDYLQLFASAPLLFPPGTQHHYGNVSYVVLGALIECITGVSYYEHIRQSVFVPAGMTSSGFFEMDLPVSNFAVGYTTQNWFSPDDGQRRANNYIYAVKGSPSEHCFSTTADLFAFFLALRAGQLLPLAVVEQCITPQVDTGQPGISYGYGFHIIDDGKHGQVVGHGGKAMGGDAFAVWYRDLGSTLVVLSNYDRPAARRVMNAVADRLIG